jgi:hypothetical protein
MAEPTESSNPTVPDPTAPDPAVSEGADAGNGPRGLAAVFGPAVNAIVAPGKAYDALAQRPLLSLWIVLWVTVAMTALTFANLDVQRQFMRIGFAESIAQGNTQMEPEQAARALETMDKWAPAFGLAQSLFLVLLIGVYAAVIWGGASIAGGSTRFSLSAAVASVASVAHPLMATAYVSLLWNMSPPEIRRMSDIPEAVPTLGLDLLLGNPDMSMTLRTFLMRVDLFNLWWVILVVMGCERLLRMKRGGAIAVAVTIWLVSSALGAFLSGMNG